MRRTTTVRPSFSPTAKASRWSIWSLLFWTKRFSSSIGSSRSTHSSAPSAAPPGVSLRAARTLPVNPPSFQSVGPSGSANSITSYTSRNGASSRSAHCRGADASSSLPGGGLRWSASGWTQPTSTQTRGRAPDRRGGRPGRCGRWRGAASSTAARRRAAGRGPRRRRSCFPASGTAAGRCRDAGSRRPAGRGRLGRPSRTGSASVPVGRADRGRAAAAESLASSGRVSRRGGAADLAELDAEAAEVVLGGARQWRGGFDPDLVLVVEADHGGALRDGRRHGPARHGEAERIKIGELQDHQISRKEQRRKSGKE